MSNTKNDVSKREIERHIKMYQVMLNTLDVMKEMVTDHKENAEGYLQKMEGQTEINVEPKPEGNVSKKK
jgi:hypothetical protein